MLPETVDLYSKYIYFLHLLSNERLMLFKKSENELDYESFFDQYNFVIYKHTQLKPMYGNFKNTRGKIFKKFNSGKLHILLRPYFCYDLRCIIISFCGI